MIPKFTIIALLFCFGCFEQQTIAQTTENDTAHLKFLPEITIVGKGSRSDIQQLPEIVGTTIYAGKKTSLIVVDNVQGNTATNTMRQVMAKVPGIHIWESDASGIQIGIAARGLSPNRSWEFNVRQNGYDIAADPFGYPEAYYNPQLQSVQRIEVVRGQGALQYGPQFGGMINYILKNGSDITQPFQIETEQTIGSNGLFNSYNAIGGKTKKIHYYTFFDHRNADAWRDNSRYHTNAGFGTVTYKPTTKLSVTAELMRWNMLSQQAGGLTDEQFADNAQQSFRSRNWFNLTWTTTALITNYQFSDATRLNVKLFGMNGDRNSVGFMPSQGIVEPDAIDSTTLQYGARAVNIDQYRNYGMEARFITDYALGGQKHTFSAGLRAYNGNTKRYKSNNGTTGTEYDVSLTNDQWASNIDYRSTNAAVFVENIFRVREKLAIIPGIRYEYLRGAADGYNSLNAANEPILLQNQESNRSFVLAGIGSEWHVTKNTEVYANISQAYRPIQFADLTTPPTTDQIDPNLTDAKGYNADLGYRGKISDYLFFDASAYYLQYNNRVGTIKQQNADGNFYNLRTNVGDSHSKGIEAMVECNFMNIFTDNSSYGDLSAFASYSYNDARYKDFKATSVVDGVLQEKNYANNKVENAPENILRAGVTYSWKSLALTTQYSYVDEAFADANNTETPSANGQNGLIPSYQVWDITLSYRHKQRWHIKTGVNNLTDARYFTRRSGGFPGPGLLPADGRTWFVGIAWKL
ncbi:MAG: TonB-dependent receptor [Chitinophagales bacterium]|nr:TonB-dependent receptor [Chitinophagales bacterium]